MLSLNQFTFGVGAFLAPQLSSNIIPHFEGGYRTAYGFLLIFVCIAIIYLFLTKFNYKRKLNGEDDKPQLKMSQVLGKGPLWLFTITFSFMTAMYYITVDWSLIYLQDVYGWDPNEKGATYMTIFTACYMVSRLLLKTRQESVVYYWQSSICVFDVLLLFGVEYFVLYLWFYTWREWMFHSRLLWFLSWSSLASDYLYEYGVLGRECRGSHEFDADLTRHHQRVVEPVDGLCQSVHWDQ